MLIFPQIAAQTLKPPWLKTLPCSIYVPTACPSAAQPDNSRLQKVLGLLCVFIFSPSLPGPGEAARSRRQIGRHWTALPGPGTRWGPGEGAARAQGTAAAAQAASGHWAPFTQKWKFPLSTLGFFFFFFFWTDALKLHLPPLPGHWEVISAVPGGASGALGCA